MEVEVNPDEWTPEQDLVDRLEADAYLDDLIEQEEKDGQ